MNIKVWDGKYVIRSDKYQYKLIELKQKAGDEAEDEIEQTEDGIYEVTIGYYPTLRYLFKSLVETEGRQNRCTTMEGYIRHIEKINAQLEETLEKMQALIGAEESLSRIMYKMWDKLPESVAGIGEPDEKPKRGRKKKG